MAASKLRILVTGAAGLLGQRLTLLLAEKHEVIAVVRKSTVRYNQAASIEVERCDLSEDGAAAWLVRSADPDVVVNCAAMTDVDGCDENPDLAERANSGIVSNLLSAVDSSRTRFVQISTDYLFDGKSGPYPEDSPAGPVNVYGRTKLNGELVVKAWGGDSLIVRTSALYDCRLTAKSNLFTSAFRRFQNGQTVQAAHDLFCNPLWVVNLSQALEETIEKRILGIMNIGGGGYLSRYEFCKVIAEHFGFRSELVKGIPVVDFNRVARRPLLAGVDISHASRILRTKLLSPVETFRLADFDPR